MNGGRALRRARAKAVRADRCGDNPVNREQAEANACISLYGPETREFPLSLREILGSEPADWLVPALPYSAIAENRSGQTIALIGIRFDLTAKTGKKMSTIQVADTLRNPEQSDFKPGATRLFCVEPEFVTAAMRGESTIGARAALNLNNLRSMLSVRASIDCFAFADGRFYGSDTGGTFERFARQRESEQTLISRVLSGKTRGQHLLTELDSSDSARRALAAKLIDELAKGGTEAMLDCARKHRFRIALLRTPQSG